MAHVLIYATRCCPYCVMARRLLKSKGVAYEEVLVESSATRAEMTARSGRYTVPQIWIDDRHIGGYDDISALERQGQLDPLLNT